MTNKVDADQAAPCSLISGFPISTCITGIVFRGHYGTHYFPMIPLVGVLITLMLRLLIEPCLREVILLVSANSITHACVRII